MATLPVQAADKYKQDILGGITPATRELIEHVTYTHSGKSGFVNIVCAKCNTNHIACEYSDDFHNFMIEHQNCKGESVPSPEATINKELSNKLLTSIQTEEFIKGLSDDGLKSEIIAKAMSVIDPFSYEYLLLGEILDRYFALKYPGRAKDEEAV